MAGGKLRLGLGFSVDLKEFSTKMQNVNRDLMKVGQQMQNTGKQMSTHLTLPIAAVGAIGVKTFLEFEQATAKVNAISRATGEEFKALQKNALELGRTTRYTSSQVAELQLNLSKLGLTPEQILKSTSAILSLALATGEDLAQSATVAAATMRGFGLQATDVERIADVMADSFSSTALDLAKFQMAMATVAPVSKEAGATLEQTTAILGLLMNRGVDASTAGSALRNIFLDLAGSGMSWGDAMDRINKSTNPLKDAFDMFGKRGALVATIVAKNREELNLLTADFEDSRGEAQRMANIMDDTLNGAMLRMKSAMEGAAISIGEALAPMVNKLMRSVEGAASWFNNLSKESRSMILVIGGIVAALGPLIFMMGSLILFTKTLPIHLITIKGALIGITGPIGLSVIAIAALAYGIYKLVGANKEYNAVSKDVVANVASERAGLNALFGVLKTTTEGTAARKDAVNAINEKYGEYLPNLLTEKSSIEDITVAQNAANKSLLQSIVLKSKANDLSRTEELFLEKTKKGMDMVNKVSRDATTRRSGHLKNATKEEARALEISILKMVDLYKNEGSKKIYQESAKMASAMGLAFDNSKMFAFQNAVVTITNAEKERHNNLVDINSEYRKLAELMGVSLDAPAKIISPTQSTGGTITTTGGGNQKPVDLTAKIDAMNAMFEADADKWHALVEAKQLEVERGVDEYISSLEWAVDEIRDIEQELGTIGIQLPEIGVPDVSTYFKKFADRLIEGTEAINILIQESLRDIAFTLADGLGRSLAGGEFNIGQALLDSLGTFAQRFGAILIGIGIGIDALKESLKLMNPVVALVAGVALVALGGAAKQVAANMGANPLGGGGAGGGSYAPSYSGYSPSYGGGTNAPVVLQTVVYGQDIHMTNNRAGYIAGRTRRK